MTFSETPGEAKQKECHRLIMESLSQDYLQLELVDELMIHEVIDYNKAFGKAAEAAKNVTKPAE